MIENQPATTNPGEAFNSFAELQQAHITLMAQEWRQTSAAIASDSDVRAQIQALIEKIRKSGAHIEDVKERQVAQNILDYWSAQTIAIDDLGGNDWSPARLRPFESAIGVTLDLPPAPEEARRRLNDARKKIQMGAMARLWKESGRDDGYLLDGSALTEADSLSRDDRDIADFVEASVAASRSRLKQKLKVRAWVAIIMAVLAVAAVGASILAVIGWRNSQRNEEASLKAITGALRVVSNEVNTGAISVEAARRVLATHEIGEFLKAPEELIEESRAGESGRGWPTKLVALLQAPLAFLIGQPSILTATRIELLTAASDVREIMGNDSEALKYAKVAETIAGRFLEEDPGNRERKKLLYETAFRAGDLLSASVKYDDALGKYDRALRLATELTEGPNGGKWLPRVAFIEAKRGDIFRIRKNKDWEKSKDAYDHEVRIGQTLAGDKPDDIEAQWTLGTAKANQGNYFAARYGSDDNLHQHFDEILDQYQEALRIREMLAKRFPSNLVYRSNLAKSYEFIGNLYKRDKRLEEALQYYGNALNVKHQTAECDLDNTTSQAGLANQYAEIGDLLTAKHDPSGAINNYREALAIRERLVSIDKGNVGWNKKVADTHDKLAKVLGGEQQFSAASEEYSAALAIRKELARQIPGDANLQLELALGYERIGDNLGQISSPSLQSQVLQQAINAYKEGLSVVKPDADPEIFGRLQTKIEDLTRKMQ